MGAEIGPFSGVVLAGGRSQRMGRDKALVELGGRLLIEIAVEALTEAGASEVFVVGGDEDSLGRLGLRVVPDDHPGSGPLGAVITALRSAREPVVVVLACDHVATEAPAVRTVVGALGDADVVIPTVDGRAQTLHAGWRRRALEHLEAAFERGERSVIGGVEGLAVAHLLDGDPCWFADADTPDDLREAAQQPRRPSG